VSSFCEALELVSIGSESGMYREASRRSRDFTYWVRVLLTQSSSHMTCGLFAKPSIFIGLKTFR
jgi:hypothetical protein